MFMLWLKRFGLALLAVLVAIGVYIMIRPQPVPVDVARISRGVIEDIIDEDGETRVKDVYHISAPIAGKLERLTVEAGDRVARGERLARIRPADPPIRDLRTRRELAAATAAARAGVKLAEAEVAKALSARNFAAAELKRSRHLAKSNTIPARDLQQAEMNLDVKNAQLAEARANLDFRQRELDTARVRESLPVQFDPSALEDQCCVAIVSPIAGMVLKVLTESEQVVRAGTPLVDVGDLHNLEIKVDLLSADAVGLKPGMTARIENWGGEGALPARIRRIDPAGFTKVSALGIEEQRVNVLLDFTGPATAWRTLGHDFRVTVRIIREKKTRALLVPLGALFRRGDQWVVYAEKNGRAVLTPVTPGIFSASHAEVLDGLEENTPVIVYPNDRIRDGTPIVHRGDTRQ